MYLQFEFAVLLPELSQVDPEIRAQVGRDAMYAHYIKRQERDITLMKRDESQEIPSDFDYSVLQGLSNELRTKLSSAKPSNIAQAGKVDGMTPSALALILFHLRRGADRRGA